MFKKALTVSGFCTFSHLSQSVHVRSILVHNSSCISPVLEFLLNSLQRYRRYWNETSFYPWQHEGFTYKTLAYVCGEIDQFVSQLLPQIIKKQTYAFTSHWSHHKDQKMSLIKFQTCSFLPFLLTSSPSVHLFSSQIEHSSLEHRKPGEQSHFPFVVVVQFSEYTVNRQKLNAHIMSLSIYNWVKWLVSIFSFTLLTRLASITDVKVVGFICIVALVAGFADCPLALGAKVLHVMTLNENKQTIPMRHKLWESHFGLFLK